MKKVGLNKPNLRNADELFSTAVSNFLHIMGAWKV